MLIDRTRVPRDLVVRGERTEALLWIALRVAPHYRTGTLPLLPIAPLLHFLYRAMNPVVLCPQPIPVRTEFPRCNGGAGRAFPFRAA